MELVSQLAGRPDVLTQLTERHNQLPAKLSVSEQQIFPQSLEMFHQLSVHQHVIEEGGVDQPGLGPERDEDGVLKDEAEGSGGLTLGRRFSRSRASKLKETGMS